MLQPVQLMREHLMDRIFLGLGVPKVALGIPDGSNRSVSEVQREMLLADKVAPYQRQVRQFLEGLYRELFGKKPAVVFDPVDVRDGRGGGGEPHPGGGGHQDMSLSGACPGNARSPAGTGCGARSASGNPGPSAG